ncbi:unnamed protein product [Peronospora belbahrii]|uniref:Uncharacterized protein n=1 Tax=Peronospora belbahrii TaxID=622444 RepID=A0ABN8D2K5_9STRA|nr:unnamed protein product [Peronospora belbahrii]
MRPAFCLFLAFPAFAAARNDVVDLKLGGWSEAHALTNDDKLVLVNALSGKCYSNVIGSTQVCISEVNFVKTQVVSGFNYCFSASGCNVTISNGMCSSSTLSTCQPTQLKVLVFEQPWTNTLKVLNIEEIKAADAFDYNCTKNTKKSALEEESYEKVVVKTNQRVATKGFSEDEKKEMDDWIQAHGLNQYGDVATTMYTGGTPLFNENKGTTTERYAYILSRHPDRPWQSQTATQFTVEKAPDETREQGSVAGVFAMLVVFTVVLVCVAIVKMHQERRDRFLYSPIDSRK